MLGVLQRAAGGSVKDSELVVEYSYFGAAMGKWDERTPTESEALRAEWGDATRDLYLNENVFLTNVPREIWRYELGGYPVLKKWLGYRHTSRRGNRPLSLSELDELRSIVLRIAALLTMRPALDAAYERAIGNAWSVEELSVERVLP